MPPNFNEIEQFYPRIAWARILQSHVDRPPQSPNFNEIEQFYSRIVWARILHSHVDGPPQSCCQCFSTSKVRLFIQKGVGTLHKLHGVFLYHAGHFPPKAHCARGNLSGGLVAGSKCFVLDLPKGSMVVMCYRSKKNMKSFLVSWRWGENRLGSFNWECTAKEQYGSQPCGDQLQLKALLSGKADGIWTSYMWHSNSMTWSKVTINVCILQGSLFARKSSKLMVHVKVEEYLSDNL